MSKNKQRSVEDQIVSGVLIVGRGILVLAWAILAASGVLIAFGDPGPRPRWTGWAALAIAAVSAGLTIDYWAKVIPEILSMGAVGSFLSLVTGRGGADPSFRISPLMGATMVAAFVACNALAVPISKRELTAVDRASVAAFLVSFVLAFALLPSLIGFFLMFCSLAVAQLHHRFYAPRKSKKLPMRPPRPPLWHDT